MDYQSEDHSDTKISPQRNWPQKYRPITCIPMMWKILTIQIREMIYYSLKSRGIFPDKQKGCHKRSRGREGPLYRD